MSTRRDIIALVGGAAATWPVAAAAQSRKVWRVGFISGGSPAAVSDVLAGFAEGMRSLGYLDGRDFKIEWRFADGHYERIPGFAAELVELRVDVFVLATTAAIKPVQEATSTIPIVMGISHDPVGSGFVASLARPGANTTGLASSADDSSPKQVELLGTLVPNLSRIGYFYNPGNPNTITLLHAVQAVSKASSLTFVPAHVQNATEIEQTFQRLAQERVDAILFSPDALFMTRRTQIAALALSVRMPSMFSQREYVEAGGLMSYGENLKDFFRRAAGFVDKIFKGAKPSDLPIEQPTKFHLTINRRTANALGLIIPPQLYVFADEIIE